MHYGEFDVPQPDAKRTAPASTEQRRHAFTEVQLSLILSLTTLLIIIGAWSIFTTTAKKPSDLTTLPSHQSQPDNKEQRTALMGEEKVVSPPISSVGHSISYPFIKEEQISAVYAVQENAKAYYLKSGNIWVADLTDAQLNTALLLDVEEHILTFDISNNQNLVAYSVERSPPDPDDPWGSMYGDTILVRSLKNGGEVELYSDRNATQSRLSDMLFSLDGSQLIFTNNSIWVADLTTKNLQKYQTQAKTSYYQNYYLQDMSNNGEHVLAVLGGAYGGSSQVVFNVRSRRVEGTFENGFSTGTTGVGFVTNNTLLAYNNETDGVVKLGLYDLSGKIISQIKEIQTLDNPRPMYFDNKSVVEKVALTLPSDTPTLNGQALYELDRRIGVLSETPGNARSMVVVKRENVRASSYSVWITNTLLEDPKLVDLISSVESGELLLTMK